MSSHARPFDPPSHPQDPLTASVAACSYRESPNTRATYGHVRTSPTTIELFCPLDVGTGRLAHRVTVWHQAWETPTAAQIDAAFIEHYTAPYDEDRCPDVPARPHRPGGAA